MGPISKFDPTKGEEDQEGEEEEDNTERKEGEDGKSKVEFFQKGRYVGRLE